MTALDSAMRRAGRDLARGIISHATAASRIADAFVAYGPADDAQDRAPVPVVPLCPGGCGRHVQVEGRLCPACEGEGS